MNYKKFKNIFNFIYYSFFIIILIFSLILLIKPGIFFNNFNNIIIINNKSFNIKFNKVNGNIFQGLYFENFNLNNDKTKYYCSQIYIKPNIISLFTKNKIFDEINIKCNKYNINKKINKNFKENIKNYISNINNKIKIKKLEILINNLNFQFTKMSNLLIIGNYENLKNKIYYLNIKFNYFDKNYHIILNSSK